MSQLDAMEDTNMLDDLVADIQNEYDIKEEGQITGSQNADIVNNVMNGQSYIQLNNLFQSMAPKSFDELLLQSQIL